MEIFLDAVDAKTAAEIVQVGVVRGITTNPSTIRKNYPDALKGSDSYYKMCGEYFRSFLDLCVSYKGCCKRLPELHIQVHSNGPDDTSSYIHDQFLKVREIAKNIHKYGSRIHDCTNNSSCHKKPASDLSRTPMSELSQETYDSILQEMSLRTLVVKMPFSKSALFVCKELKGYGGDGKRINITTCFSLQQAIMVADAGADYVSVFVGRLEDMGVDGMLEVEKIKKAYKHYGYKTKILVASVRNVEHVRRAAELGAEIATMPMSVFNELYHHEGTDAALAKFCSDW